MTSRLTRFGKFELPEERVRDVRTWRNNALEGCDIQFALDCSGSMQWTYSDTKAVTTTSPERTRFFMAKKIINTLAEEVFKHDDSIEMWKIQLLAGASAWSKSSYLKTGLKDKNAVKNFMDSLTPTGGTPLREVLVEVLNAFKERLAKDPLNTKPLSLVVVGDGHDGNIDDIIQGFAANIRQLTNKDPREKLGIQFVLVSQQEQVLKDFEDFDDKKEYMSDGKPFECDIVDVTNLQEIEDLGTIESELCQAKILAGALNPTLDDLVKALKLAGAETT
ncbi:hypothetical protein BDV96DRAFT_286404 [Lophiotrema nucula]|uniref:VWFA domain-containing protein n=1 Tax=Lophiotrema nucula TaxID=690887 RepID=A0A6A5YP51_9PLEO|nr:hypothetical protein BDV96DRAFT_286404 [Lophiotrema nucula]